VFERVRDGFADSNGVNIHYAALGRRGPLVVMTHGFPDFWYTWRDQMAALSRHYQVVAIDQRGYNLSDKPSGVEQYDIELLVADVAAVIRDRGRESAVVVGHDWGGAVAWFFAMRRPEMTERLVILNTPHPRALLRELRDNPQQRANSFYARVFQEEGAHLAFTAEGLAAWVTDPVARTRYVEAFARSDFEAMLNYYKRNYPRDPYADVVLPIVQAPVLVIHGLEDPFLLAAGLDGTWEFLAQPLTLVTVPGAGHFVQQDASALVTRTIKQWLAAQDPGH
jgi:pimeloyl-ACP methyl ester carboxylesterase